MGQGLQEEPKSDAENYRASWSGYSRLPTFHLTSCWIDYCLSPTKTHSSGQFPTDWSMWSCLGRRQRYRKYHKSPVYLADEPRRIGRLDKDAQCENICLLSK